MNATEKIAYAYLQSKGYTNITKSTGKGLPDFVCDQGWFEIKSVKCLVFSLYQLVKFQPEDTVLIFDKEKLVFEFKWKDLAKVQIGENKTPKKEHYKCKNCRHYVKVKNRNIRHGNRHSRYRCKCKNPELAQKTDREV